MLTNYLKITLFICFVMILVTSCAHPGPKVTACVINASLQGCDCFNETTGATSFKTLVECDKYVALSPTDAETLFNYCASK